MDEDKRTHMALFRYGVIAPLVCGDLKPEEKTKLRREILARDFEWPDGGVRRVSEGSLRRWQRRYRLGRFAGLLDNVRADHGSCRAIPASVLLEAERLRRELPTRSVSTIVSLLESAGFDASSLAETTLGRHLNRRGASKVRLAQSAGDYQQFAKDTVNALWQADTAAGIWLPDPYNPNRVKRTKLVIFIDDCSRLCPHAQFYWDEQLPSLIDCFRKALMKRGKAKRLLFDNAFIFHSTTITRMCAELGIQVSFCKPFSPSTKGKVERMIASLKSRFYPEAQNAGLTRLEELNAFLFAWLSKDYHRRKHSSLDNMTPLERWRQDEEKIERVKPEAIKRALMLRASRRVHVRTGTISLEARMYQASPELAGQTVEVRWHAGDPEVLEVWKEGRMICMAEQVTIGANVDFGRLPKRVPEQGAGSTMRSSRTYAQSLISSHCGETELLDVPAVSQDYLSQQKLAELFTSALERELSTEELAALTEFFVANAPLKAHLVAERLETAISAKGPDRHLRFYLEQVCPARAGR